MTAGSAAHPWVEPDPIQPRKGSKNGSAFSEFGLEESRQCRQGLCSVRASGRYQDFAALRADQRQQIQEVLAVYGVSAFGDAHIRIILTCDFHDLRGHPRMDSQLVRYDEFLLQYNRLSTKLMFRAAGFPASSPAVS